MVYTTEVTLSEGIMNAYTLITPLMHTLESNYRLMNIITETHDRLKNTSQYIRASLVSGSN